MPSRRSGQSPLRRTDDGNVQVTRDGGGHWQNLTSKFTLPCPRWVSRVVASSHEAGTAYVSFDGHQDDDFKPYVFKTTDFGTNWTSAAGDLPDGMVIHTLAEHPGNRSLLLAGTEFGLFVTHTGGKSWTLVRDNLPRVHDDVLVNRRTNDVILGTHGRSIIILDDATMLEKTDPTVIAEEAHLFPTRLATQYYETRMVPSPGAAKYSGPNPPYGALITYYLKSEPPSSKSKVKIKILDKDGHIVRELDGPDQQGYNRVAWDLRYPLTYAATDQDQGGWFGRPRHAGPAG